MKYPFAYTTIFVDDTDGTTRYRRESGMGLADSYKDACGQLEDYYGNDLVSVKHLELFEDSSLITLPEHIALGYGSQCYFNEARWCDEYGNLIPEEEVEESVKDDDF